MAHKWHDILYFSKGERNALSLLLFLITVALILLIITDNKKEGQPVDNTTATDTIRFTSQPHPDKVIAQKKQIIKTSTRTKKIEDSTIKKKSSKTFSATSNRKFPLGTVIEINGADTTVLKKIPGIGSAYAKRIVKYRELLGGYICIEQLSEVYGIDEELYLKLKNWFCIDTSLIRKININTASFKELLRHPYLNKQQVVVINNLKELKGSIKGVNELSLLEEFDAYSIKRITPYICFE